MHRERTQRLWRLIQLLGSGVDDRFRAPDADFGVNAFCGDTRAVWVDVHGEYR